MNTHFISDQNLKFHISFFGNHLVFILVTGGHELLPEFFYAAYKLNISISSEYVWLILHEVTRSPTKYHTWESHIGIPAIKPEVSIFGYTK